MKINKRFYVEKVPHNYVLVERIPVDKEKNKARPKKLRNKTGYTTHRRFYGTLEFLLIAVMDMELKVDDGVQECLDSIVEVRRSIKKFIKKYGDIPKAERKKEPRTD